MGSRESSVSRTTTTDRATLPCPGDNSRPRDEREVNLKAAEAVLQEREAFIERSENTISEKGQQLQEWEAELEHLHDELKGDAH